ncbi:type II secretion system F family protein [Herbaspirillum sp.]|uniref:type II secretion system F family protein n=1 Tax=Herbaspirillum sp. TaxID=1890675 RepID=UPI001B027A53|nr:type II secretion system F family protein [Herbaspirillum sp.]MBO9537647.1 type II secretion system F family protein [Herbaspirillum sp.]
MLLLPILVFFAVTLGLAALFLWLAPSRTTQRLRAMSGGQDQATWSSTMVSLVGPFARLSSPSGNWETSALRLKFIRAGIRSDDARIIYFGLKTLLPVVFLALAYLALQAAGYRQGMGFLLYLLVTAAVGCVLPNVLLHWMMRRRVREMFENFPDAADLLLICIEAGLGLDASLLRVAEEIRLKSSALADELHLTNLEIRAGGTRESALHNLALRTGVEEIVTFATMLNQADKFGTSIGDSLRVFSEDLRNKRQARAEEKAVKVPTKMLFPLVVFIFPAIVMVIMGPAVIRLVRTILPMLNGGG